MGRAVRFGRAAPAFSRPAGRPRCPCRRARLAGPAAPRVAAPAPDQPGPAPLSDEQALKGSLDTRLAYIITGDKEVDDSASRAWKA